MLFLSLISLLLGFHSFAEDTTYPSGLIHYYSAPAASLLDSEESEEAAIQNFLQNNFSKAFPPPFESRKVKSWSDATHSHSEYQLFYEKIPVLDYFLKFHYHHEGYLEYVTSLWETSFRVETFTGDADLAKLSKVIEKLIHKKVTESFTVQKVFYVLTPQKKAIPAFEVIYSALSENIYKHWILEAKTLKVLEDRKTIRFLTSSNQKVYKTSPLGMGNTFDTDDIVNLNSLTDLSNSYIRVRREENSASPTLKDVDPTVDYTTTGSPAFSTDPTSYSPTCVAPNICPNQSFDAVNVYYHINDYRAQLATYFSTLGSTSTVSGLLTDPLQVILNSLSISGTNNAAYVSSSCQSGIDRCLVFFRPATKTTSVCTGTSASIVFYDLAREAIVLTHEYQHYITDKITSMISGSVKYNAGDALHEGYSDYFGASQVSRQTGSTVTEVGKYGFQNCTPLIRDLATVRVFTDSSSDADPHISGLSWASGLWYLRTQYGRETVDLLALKSLFFLSRKPSFYEAIESLVKADQALYNGAYTGVIRNLFYNQIKLVGAKSGVFSDINRGIVQVGFKGCASSNPFLNIRFSCLSAFLLMFIFAVGRLWRRE